MQAAIKTVNDKAFTVHSLHCYFLLPTKVRDIIYHVDRLRDGRSFISRAVRAGEIL